MNTDNQIVQVSPYNTVYIQNGKRVHTPTGQNNRYYNHSQIVHLSNGDVMAKGKKVAVWYHSVRILGSYGDSDILISHKNYNLKKLEQKFYNTAAVKNRFSNEMWEIVQAAHTKYGNHYIVREIANKEKYSSIRINRYREDQYVSMSISSEISDEQTDKVVLDVNTYEMLHKLDRASSSRWRRKAKSRYIFIQFVYSQLKDKNRYDHKAIVRARVNGREYIMQENQIIEPEKLFEVSDE